MLNKEICLKCNRQVINAWLTARALGGIELMKERARYEHEFNFNWNKREAFYCWHSMWHHSNYSEPPERCLYALEHIVNSEEISNVK